MTEQINSQTTDQSVIKQVLSDNPESNLEIKTKIESDEDGIQYDRLVVNKIKEFLNLNISYSASKDKEENIKGAFDLLEITGASSVEDVIDKMHSNNYNRESLDLKLNSFARAIYELAPKHPQGDAVIEGPYAVEKYLLNKSKTTRGIGEKVVAFLTTNKELRRDIDIIDALTNGDGEIGSHLNNDSFLSKNEASELFRNASTDIGHIKTSSFKDDQAKKRLEDFTLSKIKGYFEDVTNGTSEVFRDRHDLEFLKDYSIENYKGAISLVDSILISQEGSLSEKDKNPNKTIIPFFKKSEEPINSSIATGICPKTEYSTAIFNQEGENVNIVFKINQKGSVSVEERKTGGKSKEEPKKTSFPFADVRGATEYFIKTYKDYKEINTPDQN